MVSRPAFDASLPRGRWRVRESPNAGRRPTLPAHAPLPLDLATWTPPRTMGNVVTKHLWEAVRANDVVQLEQALSEGASVDSTTTVGDEIQFSEGSVSALMLSIKLGNDQAARLLLERGADVHWPRPHNGFNPLHVAASTANLEMIEALAAAGSHLDATTNQGITPVVQGEQL